MKKLGLVAIAVLVAVGLGAVVWFASDGGDRNSGALVETKTGDVITSPNGDYSLSVLDTGIVMKGPNGSVELAMTGLKVKSGGALSIQGSGPGVNVQGAIVNLCGSGGRPVARLGDIVNPSGPGGPGTIAQGSQTVLAC